MSRCRMPALCSAATPVDSCRILSRRREICSGDSSRESGTAFGNWTVSGSICSCSTPDQMNSRKLTPSISSIVKYHMSPSETNS